MADKKKPTGDYEIGYASIRMQRDRMPENGLGIHYLEGYRLQIGRPAMTWPTRHKNDIFAPLAQNALFLALFARCIQEHNIGPQVIGETGIEYSDALD